MRKKAGSKKVITVQINKGPFVAIVSVVIVALAVTVAVMSTPSQTKVASGNKREVALKTKTDALNTKPARRQSLSDSTATTAPTTTNSGNLVSSYASGVAHVQNPFAQAAWFVNPSYVKQVDSSYLTEASLNPSLAKQMESVATYPTAIWLDSINSIYGRNGSDNGYSLAKLLNDALQEQQKVRLPEVVELVIYDMPGRDCAALASNGTIPLTSSGLTTYENNFINPIYRIIAQPKYKTLRIVTVIEPDSLPNLITNLSSSRQCALAQSTGIYTAAVDYDLDKFSQLPYVYNYLDIGHSAWLGWPTNLNPAVQLYTSVVKSTTKGFASVSGFITDTANYVPVKEPYMTATEQIGGQPVDSATFYQYDPDIDEADYTANLYNAFTQNGWPTTVGFIIDTSRDGWGGPSRPTGPSTSASVNTFVAQSKIDRRPYRGLWCNQAGAGMGYRPQANPKGYPDSHLQAFVWVKPPGQSDGAGKYIPNTQGKKFDPNCSSTYQENEYGYVGSSNALPNAPLAGAWFKAQFKQLVENAYPPIPQYKNAVSAFQQPLRAYVPSGVTPAGNAKPKTTGHTTPPKKKNKKASKSAKKKTRKVKVTATTKPVVSTRPTAPPAKYQAGEIPLCKGRAGVGYFHTSGNQILDSHNCPVRIAGVNWYGFETPDEIAHGLWTQSYQAILNEIKADGYNTIRLPYSDQMIQSPIVPQNMTFTSGTGTPINTQLKGKNAFQDLVIIVDYATKIGLKVILDQHRSKAGESASSNGLWYDSIYSTQNWINDWVLLAKTFKNNTNVIGADLHNEPHTPSGMAYSKGATWGTGGRNDWRLAAQQAGDAILKVNPHWLIFVEGIGENPTTNPNNIPATEKASSNMNATWWGGDLSLVKKYPVVLSVAHQLVYSAHEYGPVEYQQTWFNSSTSYKTLESVWNMEWGYIYRDKIAPVWIGEFGTGNTAGDISASTPGSQGQWFSDFVTYLQRHPFISWTYWAANGEDSYALLNSDYSGIANQEKQNLLQTIQFPLAGDGSRTSAVPTQNTSAPSNTNSGNQVTTTTATPPTATPPTGGSPAGTSVASAGSGQCSATIAVASKWTNQGSSAFTANGTVQAKSTVSGWQIDLTLPPGEKITNSWNVVLSGNSGAVVARNAAYNGNLSSGQSTTFGFQATVAGSTMLPNNISCQ